MSNKPKFNSIQSITRAFDIIRLFEQKELLGITEISDKAGLHKSTVYGIVSTLKELNILEKDTNSGLYRLGIELYRMGMYVDMSLSKVSNPELKRLVDELEETANLIIPYAGEPLIISKFESNHSVRFFTYVGQRLPRYCTATGKLILAYMSPEEAEEIIKNMVFFPYTKNTIKSKEELKSHLENVRLSYVAYDKEEFEEGLVSIAVPIIKDNKLIGAISVSGVRARMGNEKCDYVEAALRKSRKIIERLINPDEM